MSSSSFSKSSREGFWPESVRKKAGSWASEFFVFEHIVGDAPGVHGGVVEEFVPVIRAGLETELLGPFAEGVLVAWWREDLPLDLAPVAGVVAVFQAELAQAQPLFAPAVL